MHINRTIAPSFAVLLAAAAFAGCAKESTTDGAPKPFIMRFFGFRHDIRSIVVYVPQMGSPDCSRVVQDALAKMEGVRFTKPDLAARTVEVTYDALKMGIKNIEFTIADAGFDANTTQASPEARKALPAACR
jgi:copper chaperone CopZ